MNHDAVCRAIAILGSGALSLLCARSEGDPGCETDEWSKWFESEIGLEMAYARSISHNLLYEISCLPSFAGQPNVNAT